MAAMKARDEKAGTLAAIRDALLPKLLNGELEADTVHLKVIDR